MKVVILGHLLSEKDYKKLPFGKFIPLFVLRWIVSLIPDNKKFVVSSHYDILGKTDGYVVSMGLTPKQMMNWPRERVRKIMLSAVLHAQNKLKCDLLMLGALTAPVAAAGLWLREQPELTLKINTGNTYTAAISIMEAEETMRLAGMSRDKIKLAIVGAAGVIGGAITRYFNDLDYDLILIERDMEKFDRIKPYLKGDKYLLSEKIGDVIGADIIITATAHPEALILPEHLKKNAIIVDVAEPPDVVEDIDKKRPDVIHVDGGRVKWKKVDLKVDFGLPKNVGFACITEALMQALENDNNDYIGTVEMDHLKKTIEWGKKWDFPMADFTCFNTPIPLEKFNPEKR